ncbi:MAG: Alkaline phosphatase synthesis transcriptional regulatory protein PhoP [Phycisphaerae bacterium]|nr:Alkaline phosphatase synthesis transcriptional regulatory protein PhoP [Phycisphaerae bacterium]
MSKRIMVVDDEAHILHVVSLKLRNAGYEVQTAGDGEEALELALAEPPDLLITDYHMPVMNGVQLCSQLRAHEQLKSIPAVMLTARGYALEPEDMEKTGILTLLSKPFSPRELLAVVQQVLEGNGVAQGAE